MSLTDGQVFAGYTIVGRLGSGGMGEVYLAQHPRLPRRDALKVLPAALTADREYRERFSREADLASELWHPHIVGIHDRGEFEGQLWLSMDYVEGTDAAHLLRGDYRRGLPRAQACRIVAAVADALDYAHQRGLLHRDVKPANILLGENDSRDRRILLADFGIARQVGDVSGLTATNMVMGTTAYAAPEQLMGHDIDGRADQYALGCTAFHLLTGAMPFENSNAAVVISQHLSAPPPRIGDRRPELADLDAAFARVLAKSPADRFDSCAAFAAALTARPAARPAPTAVAPLHTGPTREVPAASPSSPPRRRRHIAVGLGAAVTVALIAAAVLVGTGVLNRQSTDASTESTASTAPTDAAPAVRLERYITDPSGRLTPVDRSEVATALAKLEHRHHVRLWIAYVDDFDGLTPYRWAEKAMHANGFTDTDGLLAIDTTHHTVAFRAPAVMTADGAQPRVNADVIRRERILPAVKRSEWTKAALAAANGLDTTI